MPGLAAGPEIFENIELSEDYYELHYLNWLKPLSIEETIANYAMRMSEEIKHKNPVLIGVSFGGIIVQEMSKHLNLKKLIIVSSVKTKNELPSKMKLARMTGAYKIVPTQLASKIDVFEPLLFPYSVSIIFE